jgi:hypothetical protein
MMSGADERAGADSRRTTTELDISDGEVRLQLLELIAVGLGDVKLR